MANRKAYKHGVGYSTAPRGIGIKTSEGKLESALSALAKTISANRAPVPRQTGRGS